MNRWAAFTAYELNALAIALFEMLPPDGTEPVHSESMVDTAAKLYSEIAEAEAAL